MKTIFVLLILSVFLGVLAFVGLQMRDVVTAKNYTEFWQQKAFDGGDYIYVVLGDSTGLGVGASAAMKGYAGLLVDKIRETGRGVKIVNLSSKDADFNTITNEQIPKIGTLKPDLVTVTVGMHDIDSGKDIDIFAEDLRVMLALLPSRVSFISEIPYPLTPNKETKIDAANSKIVEIANAENINVVLLSSTLNQKKYDLTVHDWGLRYPNDKGYAIWADAFWKNIQQ